MHVTRVELENIKSYGADASRGDFHFGRGTTAIVGENGAGKTTILEAIAWALFDLLEYSKEDFLRRGAKKGSVRVTFASDLDERQYTVYRDTGSGYYVFDPELKVKLAEKKQDVRAFLNLHLGVEPGTDLKGLFRSAIGVPQGFFTTDFLRTTNERKAAFDKLLKVEEYRESAERLRDTVRLISERHTEARVRVAGAEAQLARFDEIVAEHKASIEQVNELEKSLADLKREAEERARLVEELDAVERQVAETRASMDRLEVESASAARRWQDLRAELERVERAVERQKATREDHDAHLAAGAALRTLETERAERDRLTAELSSVERQIASAGADARRLQQSLERAQQARQSLVEMASDVARQEELERERERLRDLLAQARAAAERLARLDRELTVLRRQHAETRERVRASESAADAQAQVDKLESERLGIDNRLNQVVKTLTEQKLLTSQRRELAREVERLRKSVSTLEREAREHKQTASEAERIPQLEERERELSRACAQLRATIEHEQRVREETKDGVCPILRERCTSFNEGRTFDTYFGDQLKANRVRLVATEKELVQVEQAVATAREAERNLARLEASRRRMVEDRTLFSERESSLARLDEQLARLPEASEKLKDELQAELFGVDASLKVAREAAMRFTELETLRERLTEIEEEGKTKKEEREQLQAAAGALVSLEEDVRDTEASLRALRDPRSRAAAFRAEAERESSLQAEIKNVSEVLDSHEKQKAALLRRLDKFKDLDARIIEESARRERTAEGYREYLESASLASTLGTRTTEVEEASKQAAEVEENLSKARAAHTSIANAYERERHSSERGALAHARERIAAFNAQLEAAAQRESALRTEIDRLEEVRGAWRDELRAIERLENIHEATDFIRDILKQAGPLVTESYLYNISIEANQLFREITGDAERSLRWTKEYEIVLEEAGHERSFVNLSGGEQMVAALSVRLALLKQLSDIRVAFFDEPTVNMDAERRERLAQQIGQVRHFDQLFVISHDDTFEQTVDHVVTISRESQQAA